MGRLDAEGGAHVHVCSADGPTIRLLQSSPLQNLKQNQKREQTEDADSAPDLAIVHTAKSEAGEIDDTDADENGGSKSFSHGRGHVVKGLCPDGQGPGE